MLPECTLCLARNCRSFEGPIVHPRPKGERNPPDATGRDGTVLDRAKPQHNIKDRGPDLFSLSRWRGLTLCSPLCEPSPGPIAAHRCGVHRCGASLRCIVPQRGYRGGTCRRAACALRRRVHGVGVVVHGARLSNCSIANKSAAQLESASSYTRQRINDGSTVPRHVDPSKNSSPIIFI